MYICKMKLNCFLTPLIALLSCLSVCCNTNAQNYDSIVTDFERRAEALRISFQEERKRAASDLMFIGELGYEHHERYGNMVHSNMFLNWDATEWFSMLAGLRVTTNNLYNITIRGDFKLPLKDCRFIGLRNQYLYGLFAEDNFMDMNFSLAAFYEQEYFYIAAGAMTHFNTPVSVKEGKRKYDWSLSWIYDLGVWCRVHNADWNIGIQFTDMRDFEISHCNNPSFIIRGKHLIMPKNSPFGLFITWQAGCRTLIDKANMKYDGAWGTAGVRCYF